MSLLLELCLKNSWPSSCRNIHAHLGYCRWSDVTIRCVFKGPFIATQLTSTRRRVELCRYKRALTCSKKLTGSQLSLPRGINKKLKCETKNKMMSAIGPVPLSWGSPVGKRNLRWEGFVEKVGFEPGVKEWRSYGWRQRGWCEKWLTSGWGSESRQEWWSWRNESESWFQRRWH